MNDLRQYFMLDESIHFLNHGSFGATPKPVFEEYQRWQVEMERQPVHFIQHRLPGLYLEASAELARYLNCPPEDLVFVDNATWGVNVITRSFPFQQGDEVLITNHEYGACRMAWELMVNKTGAVIVEAEIPVPLTTTEDFVEALWRHVTPRTRIIFMSHMTSPTALIFPVEEVCRRAREAGILTVIDGAHCPGHIPLDLTAIGADIYTGNLHKWLCAPKGAAFLYVDSRHHDWVESLVISWGWGEKGRIVEASFVDRNRWQGTRDHAAFLAVPAAIRFQQKHNWAEVRERCHRMASELRGRIANLTDLPAISPDSKAFYMQMVACPVRTSDAKAMKQRLYDEFHIEVPMVEWNGRQFVRVSVQGYNDQADLDALYEAVARCI